MGIRGIIDVTIDSVFPLTCIECRQVGTLWCAACSEHFFVRTAQHCPGCEAITSYGTRCAKHRDHVLDGIVSSTWYANMVAKTLIRQWKYEYVRVAEQPIEHIMQRWASGGRRFPSVDWVVVPVGLHPRRKRERGFDQSEILARMLSLELGVPMRADLLVTRRYLRKRQADIANLEKRRTRNVSSLFSVNTSNGMLPSHVILVDDVYTTGTTMSAAARAFKDAGVKVIWGYAFARGR